MHVENERGKTLLDSRLLKKSSAIDPLITWGYSLEWDRKLTRQYAASCFWKHTCWESPTAVEDQEVLQLQLAGIRLYAADSIYSPDVRECLNVFCKSLKLSVMETSWSMKPHTNTAAYTHTHTSSAQVCVCHCEHWEIQFKRIYEECVLMYRFCSSINHVPAS